MNRMDWTDIENEVWRLREKYYGDQTSLELQEADILTARVMTGLKGGMRTRHVEELIENSLADRPGQRLPKGKDAKWFLNRLIHQGALYRDPAGRVHSPIPSFRRYLIEWGTEPEPWATMENDSDTNPSA